MRLLLEISRTVRSFNIDYSDVTTLKWLTILTVGYRMIWNTDRIYQMHFNRILPKCNLGYFNHIFTESAFHEYLWRVHVAECNNSKLDNYFDDFQFEARCSSERWLQRGLCVLIRVNFNAAISCALSDHFVGIPSGYYQPFRVEARWTFFIDYFMNEATCGKSSNCSNIHRNWSYILFSNVSFF